MPLGKRQRSACVGPNVSYLFCVAEKIEWSKKKFILMKKKTFLIQVDGYENSNSIGGTLNILLHAPGAQIVFDKICEGNKGENKLEL